jgi:lipopolysaccharide/colanic/teichoic acid biosynthesis glycosyltransferase
VPCGACSDVVKRAFDLVASACALVMLAPLLLAIALWVRLDSPGPVLFRQERIGREGRPFRICKFRTMVADAPNRGLQITTGRDPRITRAGDFLRRTKLDELPQLLNVLAGEMSLVGPRPEVPRYVALYPPVTRALVLSVRPGLTDEAAIRYADEGSLLAAATDPEKTYVEDILPKKLALYEEYVENQTFAGDLALIFRTLRRIWRGGG